MFLVTGATGNVGAEVVAALAKAGEPVRALVRRPDVVLPAGAEAVAGDLNDPKSLGEALKGVDRASTSKRSGTSASAERSTRRRCTPRWPR